MHKKRNIAYFLNTLPLFPRLFVSPIKVSPSDQNRIETTEQASFAWKATIFVLFELFVFRKKHVSGEREHKYNELTE